MIEITETRFGNLYKKTRDITRDDLEFTTNVTEKVSEGVETLLPHCVIGTVDYKALHPSLREFFEKSKFIIGWSGEVKIEGTLKQILEYLKFNGCRGWEGRVKKFNRVVGEVTEKIADNLEQFIDDGLEALNYRIDTFIMTQNDKVCREGKQFYCNVNSYQKEWIDGLDAPGVTKELDEVEKQIQALKEKRSQLDEQIRQGRVKRLKEILQDPEHPDNDVDPRIAEVVLEGLEDGKALNRQRFCIG